MNDNFNCFNELNKKGERKMSRLEEIKDTLTKKDIRFKEKEAYQLFDYLMLERMLQTPIETFLDYVPSWEEMEFYHTELLFLTTYYGIDFGVSTDLPYLHRIVDRYKKDHGQKVIGDYRYMVSFDDVKYEYPSLEYQGKPYTREDFFAMLQQGVKHPVGTDKVYQK